jgi:ATP-dependent DNA helicase RecG
MKLSELKGCGEKRIKRLEEENIVSIETLISYLPKKYEHHHLYVPSPIEARYFDATVTSRPKIAYIRKNLKKLTCKVNVLNQTYTLSLFNQTHWMRHLNESVKIVVYGTLDNTINAQKIFLKSTFIEGLIPFYKLKGIPDKTFQKWLEESFLYLDFKEDLSETLIDKYGLIDKKTMFHTLHFPKNLDALNQAFKTQKVRFLIDYLSQRKPRKETSLKPKKTLDLTALKKRIDALPFELTRGQKDALEDGLKDIESPQAKRRLYQGDTGSGKTVVALLIALCVLDSGAQVAFMAPTEVLAMQHYQTYLDLFKDEPYFVSYISGSLEAKEVSLIQNNLKTHQIHLIFGTHALFSSSIRFNQLGLVIVDEEQRFGVKQKEVLLKKGTHADYIALSATPIPRTLALTLYQDMEVTTIKGVPSSRMPVKTEVIPLKDATFVNPMIELTLNDDKQIFVIAPRIEEDDQLLSVERIEAYYQKTFKKAIIKTLHGKMSSLEKTRVLNDFKAKKIDLLISTTVIEVGIDVEKATLMLIYHAERFGYSQLHQLRGRLGRHDYKGVCYLLYKGDPSVKERLSLLKTVTDGFELSQIDLKSRGFGSLFGDAQSGLLESTAWPYEETMELLTNLKEDLDTE